jgi:purine nucleoside permease
MSLFAICRRSELDEKVMVFLHSEAATHADVRQVCQLFVGRGFASDAGVVAILGNKRRMQLSAVAVRFVCPVFGKCGWMRYAVEHASLRRMR